MSKKEKVKQRPLALNTVEMLRVASAALGRYKSSDFHTVLKQNILASQTKQIIHHFRKLLVESEMFGKIKVTKILWKGQTIICLNI